MSQLIPTTIVQPEPVLAIPTNWDVTTLGTKTERKLLHYMVKAINEFKMIVPGDKVMVCLSGGKDSFTLLSLLNLYRIKTRNSFSLHSYTLDQSQPGWDDSRLRAYLTHQKIEHTIETRDTYSVVVNKIPENKTYCSLCSRLRRGNIYRWAKDNGFTKVALGHHRDDMLQTLLMSLFFNGKISSMPPKLLTDNKKHILIRPLAYCQESDIKVYAKERNYPIIPCTLCGSQDNLMRKRVKKLLEELSILNPKVPSNMLHALSNVHPSQLMDKKLWDFVGLDGQRDWSDSAEDNETESDLVWSEN